MWKNKKREQTEHPGRGTGCSIRKQGMLLACALLGILLCGPLSGCGQEKVAEAEASEKKSKAIEQENPDAGEQISRIGLILTSRDDSENEQVQTDFENLAEALGAELHVKTPDVSAAEADEARGLEYRTFALCDVDPIEYQMLAVNELVAEDVDVIAIHANHEEALESVLSAARSVGVRVIAFEQPVTDAGCDGYAETSEEAVAVIKSE